MVYINDISILPKGLTCKKVLPDRLICKQILNQWSTNMHIVPFEILFPMLTVNELATVSQLNHLFKTTVYNKTKPFKKTIMNVKDGYNMSKTFKNCRLKLYLTKDNKNDDIRLLKNLYELKTEDNTITNEELQFLTNLEYLNLKHNSVITDFGLKNLKKLNTLKINFNQAKITNGIFKIIGQIHTLHLNDAFNDFMGTNLNINYFNDNCLNHLPNLTDLSILWFGLITDKGLQKLHKLEKLCLCNNSVITDNGIKHMSTLKSLDISINSMITDDGICDLINLESLYLGDNKQITNKGLIKLVNLTDLDLFDQWKVTDEGIIHLVKLKKLGLAFTGSVTDYGISKLPNLTDINLSANSGITDAGIKNLTNLKRLTVSSAKNYEQLVSNDFIKKLGEQGVEITYD